MSNERAAGASCGPVGRQPGGVSITVTAEGAGSRLDRFLVMHLPEHSRTLLSEWIRDGRVRVQGALAKPSLALKLGFMVDVDPPEPPSVELVGSDMDLRILYEDEALVVVDKPAGLVFHPGAGHPDGTLVNGLLGRYGTLSPVGGPLRPGVVHRIDRGTSGVVVVARTEVAHNHLARQFAAHTVDRRYLAVAWDHSLPETGTVSGLYGRHPTDRLKFTGRVEHGKRAVTHWRVLRRLPPCAVVECRLETGRTHQIRVHFSEMGSPLLGDATYGRRRKVDRPDSLRALGPDLGLDRQALHAQHLGFIHPVTGVHLAFTSPLPDEIASVIAALAAANGQAT